MSCVRLANGEHYWTYHVPGLYGGERRTWRLAYDAAFDLMRSRQQRHDRRAASR